MLRNNAKTSYAFNGLKITKAEIHKSTEYELATNVITLTLVSFHDHIIYAAMEPQPAKKINS